MLGLLSTIEVRTMKTKFALQASDLKAIAAAAEAEAIKNNWAVSISIVDDGGHQLWFQRLDGAPPISTLIAPAKAGLLVAEYAAKVVKKAVVGTGGADKDQVAFMIARLLPTAGSPTADAADALAVAIAHAHARQVRTLTKSLGGAA
jgi:uncharacterized protein GlcG (DUF336 family)